ncbi:transcription factor TCP17 [Manihot esculenta]|uniref:TCP domain-containing protein n=1 Tax=Manihot esculenta TaxID=3983 RepID=A0A2C9ULX4_MANES|nr:transcription factor TCP17 [Manihot esculenta]OAY31134.1 hypothetical protein MANES_14G086500v8 [Manihot esculenta]
MSRSSREKDFQAKQEVCAADDNKFTKAVPSTSSRQWSAFRNPRIVRVSRSFGGKDRHSKVCTVKGLRDRRIRLSVPTAVQLYDLQDRLGLSQPSKVIDWLIDATKDDIDKLPPLVMPQGFGQFVHPQHMLLSHEPNSSLVPNFFDANSASYKDGGFYSLGININSSLDENHRETVAKSKYWEAAEASARSGRSNEVERIVEKGKWIKTNEQENQGGFSNYNPPEQASAQMFFPLTSSSHSSLPGLPNNPLPFNPYYHWDASNLSLSHQFPTPGFQTQTETSLSNNVPLPSSSQSPFSSASQFFLCPQVTMPSLFPQYPPYATTHIENESREINHFQLLSSGSQHILPSSRATSLPMKNLSLTVNPGFAQSHQSKNVRQPDEEDNPDS